MADRKDAAWLRNRSARQIPTVGRHGFGRHDGARHRRAKRRLENASPVPDGHPTELDRDRRSVIYSVTRRSEVAVPSLERSEEPLRHEWSLIEIASSLRSWQ